MVWFPVPVFGVLIIDGIHSTDSLIHLHGSGVEDQVVLLIELIHRPLHRMDSEVEI